MVVAALIGFLFGFIGSMPVAGPIAVLIFSRAVENRIRSALYIGLGAVIPEVAYACLAFYGFSSLLASYTWIVPISRGVAAVILLGLGVSFARRRVQGEVRPVKAEGRWGSFGLGFAICGLNPTLIATWTGAATTLFSTGTVGLEPMLSIPFAIGAGVGILLWYGILVWLIWRYKKRFSIETLDKVIRVFGVVLVGIALWFAWQFVVYFVAG